MALTVLPRRSLAGEQHSPPAARPEVCSAVWAVLAVFPAVRQGSWVSTDEPGKVPVAVATVVQAALASCTATEELAEGAAAPGPRGNMGGAAPSLSNGHPHSAEAEGFR